jgi:hypothetical protein
VVEVYVREVSVVVGAWGWLGVGKLSPWINVLKFVQERVSGASLGRRGTAKIKAYLAIAGFGILLGEGRDKSRQLSVLG